MKRQPWTKKSYACCLWEDREDESAYEEIHLPNYKWEAEGILSKRCTPEWAAEEWYERHLCDSGYDGFDGSSNEKVMVREILENGSFGPMYRFSVSAESIITYDAKMEEENAKED